MPGAGVNGRRASASAAVRAQGGLLRGEEGILDLHRHERAAVASRCGGPAGRCRRGGVQLCAGFLGSEAELAEGARSRESESGTCFAETIRAELHGVLQYQYLSQ